jgi:hypothetical protein
LVRSVRGYDSTETRTLGNLPKRPANVLTCRDALHMAQVAEQLGLIDGLTVEEVQTEMGARL